MKSIQSIFRAPRFPDDERSRKASLLNALLWGVFGALGIHLGITITLNPVRLENIIIPLLTFPLLLILRALLQTGRVELVSILMIAGLFTITTTQMPGYGGVRSPAFAALTIIVLIAGLLLGFRAGLIVAVMSIFLGIALAALEVEGYLSTAQLDPTPWSFLISNIAFNIGALSVLFLAIRDISKGHERAADALSARQATIAELNRSEARYRAIVEDQTEMINRCTLEGIVTYANEAYANLFGQNPDELIGCHLSEFLSQHGLDSIINIHSRLTPANPISTSEHKVILADGSTRWLQWSDRLIFDADGESIEFQGVGRDVTEQKRAEQALRSSESLYRTTIDAMDAMIHMVDIDMDIVLANQTLIERNRELGFTTDVLNRPLVEVYPFLSKATLDEYRQVFKLATPFYTQDRDEFGGQVVFTEISKIPIIDEGRVIRVLTVIRDISERKELEETIRRSEQRFRAVAESTLIGINITNPDDVFSYVNPAFSEMVGYEPGELIGASLENLVDHETLLYLRTKTARRKRGVREQYEITMNRKDGNSRRFKIYASPLMDEDDEFQGTIAVVSDVTDQRNAERNLQRQIDELRVLHNVSTEGLATLDEDELIKHTSKVIGETFYPDHFGVLLRDPHEPVLHVHPSYHGLPEHFYRTELPIERGVTGLVARTGEPVRLDDIQSFDGFVHSTPDIRSELCVPLKVGGDVIGVINAESKLKSAFSEADERLLLTVGSLLATAIEKARLIAASQRLTHELETIYQTNLATAKLHDPTDFLTSVCDHIQDFLQFDSFLLLTPPPLEDRLEITFAYEAGEVADHLLGLHLSTGEQGPVSWVLEHGIGLLIKDTDDPKLPFAFDHQINERMGSMIAVPLVYGERQLGVLMIQSYHHDRYDSNDLNFLESLAPQIVISLENNRLFLLEQVQRSISEALLDTAMVINSTLDFEEVMSRILKNLSRVVPHDAANIMIVDEATLTTRIIASRGYEQHGISGDHLSTIRLPLGESSILGRMFDTKQPFIVHDTSEYEDWIPQPSMEWIRSYMSTPIIVEETVIGFVNLDSAAPGFFKEEHSSRLQSFANQAAIAIENATLYQELEKHSLFLEETVRSATDELRQEKERVEVIIRNSPDAIVLLTATGTIELANQAFEDLFGYTQEQIVGQSLCIIIDPGSMSDCNQILLSVVEQRTTQRVEFLGKTSKGTTIEIELGLSPILQQETTYGVVCTIRDITALKEVERLKDAFVSNVSHELRTPITSLKLNHSLLMMNPEGQSVYLERVGREIERLNTIIEDLLHLSRLDQDSTPFRIQETRIGELLKVLIADRIPLAEQNNLMLELDPIEPDRIVCVDPSFISQALSIILTNAIHYTPSGGWIRVGTRPRQENGIEWLGIQVSDSGPGILEEDFPHLFSRFYRGKAGLESGKPGTGLGLSIAKQIAEKHGGSIEVQSQPSEHVGAVFTIWLPIGDQKEINRPVQQIP